MIKTLGISLIFISTISMGIFSSYKTKNSLKQLREMINFMNYIKNQIEYFNSPLNSIYSTFDTPSGYLERLIIDISAGGWKTALENASSLYLPQKTIELLKEYGSFLGKSNKEEQLSRSEYYIQALENEYMELEKKAPERIKLSLALGLYAGLMLIILFI